MQSTSDNANGGVAERRKGRSGLLLSAALTTSAHLSKIAVGFLLLKLVAVYLGVEGMGRLGNFMSAVLFLSLLAGGGIQNGIIKYVAEYKARPRALLRFLADARAYSLGFCVLILIAALAFNVPLAHFLMGEGGYGWLVIVLGLAQFGFAFSNIVNGAANGLHQTKVYAAIQIIGNLFTLPIAWWLISHHGLAGAALAMVTFYLSYSLPALYFHGRSRLRRSVRWQKFSWQRLSRLGGFTLMAIVGSISVPLVEIVVRQLLTGTVGLEAAGLWQASIKLSSAYMGFFVVFLAAYFMPIVSAQQDRARIAGTVRKFMMLVMGLFLAGASVFYLLREYFIPLLLSQEFSGLTDFIQYQLIGDFLRIATYVIGFVVVAKAATRLYVVLEIGQGVLFCLFSVLALHRGWGLQGVFMAHVAMNVIYFLTSVIGFYFYSRRTV
ncbi:O-antigen translocase [Pseudomonas sp. NPDC089422]|uniref:O-antigen translocase n=1 Tax=Pseudomonas sp. NPDC089422 TaxID=3364466 RepID=UPI00381F8759